jgi:hypothetical protein
MIDLRKLEMNGMEYGDYIGTVLNSICIHGMGTMYCK